MYIPKRTQGNCGAPSAPRYARARFSHVKWNFFVHNLHFLISVIYYILHIYYVFHTFIYEYFVLFKDSS